jgi:beta-galactosidase GanA
LKSKFDVLVLTDGAIGRGGGERITEAKTIPRLKEFVESGGSIVTIGSSTSVAELFGVPVKNYLTEKGPDGKDRPLPREKFYIPGSLLRTSVDNTNPLAYGMPRQLDVFFDSSPVFRLEPDSESKRTAAVAWFSGPEVLDSGWAWGQQYLDGGTAVAEASVGEGKVVLLGPEVNFRDQPHATYKLLFNGLYYGSAKTAALP